MGRQEGAQVVGIAGEDIGGRDDCLCGDEGIHSIVAPGLAEQRASQPGGLLIRRENVDSVANAMDRSVARTAA